jgi:hypothetical protein
MSELLLSEQVSSRRRWRRRSRDGFGVSTSRSRSVLRGILDPSSHIPTYLGVVVVAVGFALIGIAWAQVAGLVQVWQQMPYVMSAGLPGLGLVMTGLVLINVSARRQDGAARARQMEMLTEALRDLQRSLDQ